MSQEQRSAISFELHLIRVVKNRSILTAVIAEVFEGFIEEIVKMLKICGQVDS